MRCHRSIRTVRIARVVRAAEAALDDGEVRLIGVVIAVEVLALAAGRQRNGRAGGARLERSDGVAVHAAGIKNPAPRGMDTLDWRRHPDDFNLLQVKYENFYQGRHEKVAKV